MRDSFLIYEEYEEYFDQLSSDDVVLVLKALFASFKNEPVDTLKVKMSSAGKMAFSFMNNQLKIDTQKYEERCRKNRENGSQGGRPKSEENKNRMVFSETRNNQMVFDKTQQNAWVSEKPDIDKDLDIDKDINNIVVVDKLSSNITHAREETTTSTTIKELQLLCNGLEIDCSIEDLQNYDLKLLIQKVKESRYLKLFRSLRELLSKYNNIIKDKYKDFVVNQIIKSKVDSNAKKREYTKEQLDSLFDSVDSIQI